MRKKSTLLLFLICLLYLISASAERIWEDMTIRLSNGEYIWATVDHDGSCYNLHVDTPSSSNARIYGNASNCENKINGNWSAHACSRGFKIIDGGIGEVLSSIVSEMPVRFGDSTQGESPNKTIRRMRQRHTLLTISTLFGDAGFRVPFYREVERLGWRWVGWVRGRDYVRLDHGWVNCQTLFKRATATPTTFGEGEWVRSNPLRARFVLVRLVNQGRRGNTAFGKRSRATASTHSARAAKEPWLLVTSTQLVLCRRRSWSAGIASACRSRRAFAT